MLKFTLMWFLVKIYRPSQHEGMDFPENDVSLSVVSKIGAVNYEKRQRPGKLRPQKVAEYMSYLNQT